jgi:hypothetical protein
VVLVRCTCSCSFVVLTAPIVLLDVDQVMKKQERLSQFFGKLCSDLLGIYMFLQFSLFINHYFSDHWEGYIL